MSRRALGWLAVYVLGTIVTMGVYVLVVSKRGPSSQAAELAVVVEGVDPENRAGLRVDVIIDASVRATGCAKETQVRAIISGTPQFWRDNAARLAGSHRVGIGLRTSFDRRSLRLADWAGYQLPRDLVYMTGPQVANPRSSNRVRISVGTDTSTRVRWYIATIRDWGRHWTPLVLEFKARLTSRKGLSSCYLAMPGLLGVDSPTVDDANAAAAGARSAIDLTAPQRKRGAVTFGRVIVRTNGSLLDAEARPQPRFVDGNPWVSGLGKGGEEAGVWTCAAGQQRADWPELGTRNRASNEVAISSDQTENPTCDGLAVIEARDGSAIRDLALLVVGGLFALIFARLLKELGAVGAWLNRKVRSSSV